MKKKPAIFLLLISKVYIENIRFCVCFSVVDPDPYFKQGSESRQVKKDKLEAKEVRLSTSSHYSEIGCGIFSFLLSYHL